jgi:hypothetical protein
MNFHPLLVSVDGIDMPLHLDFRGIRHLISQRFMQLSTLGIDPLLTRSTPTRHLPVFYTLGTRP